MLKPVSLTGRFVRLEPLAEPHRGELAAAGADPRIWRFLAVPGADGPDFDRWFAVALKQSAKGEVLPFAVRRSSDERLVGSTRYLNIFPAHKRLEIGSTWYDPAVWASQINPECKLLLMTHAFETLGLNRVELRCDARNERSRQAIRRLGAVEEGVLRKHTIMADGYVRDTVQFGITAAEWPAVKAGLLARLG